jgi:hypothetical protein
MATTDDKPTREQHPVNREQPRVDEKVDESRPVDVRTEQPTAADTERPTTADTERPTTADTERPTTADTERRTTADTERRKDADPYAGIAAAHERFGGIDIPATLVGMLTALSATLILAGLVSAAIGAVGYQTGLEENAEDLSTASLIGGVAVLFVAYIIGGWAAGRIARYDGARNGFATGIWTLLFAGILAGLGAWIGSDYDVFRNVELPQWFEEDALTTAAIISAVGAIVAMFAGGVLGGKWGEWYHRRADRTILSAPKQPPAPTRG